MVEQTYLQQDRLEKRKKAVEQTLSKRVVTKSKINYKKLIDSDRKH